MDETKKRLKNADEVDPDLSKLSEEDLKKLQTKYNALLIKVTHEIGKREAVGEFSKLQKEFQNVMKMNLTISQKIQEMAIASTTGASPHKTPRSRDRNHT